MRRVSSIRRCSNMALAALIILSLGLGPAPVAQEDRPYLGKVRDLDTNDLGILNPAGLAFSLEANRFFVVEAHSTTQVRIVMMAPHEQVLGLTSLNVSSLDPINIAFDGLGNRLFLFDAGTHELVAIEASPDGYLAPSPEATARFRIAELDLQTPRGMAFDATDGFLFILDSSALQIIRVKPDGRGRFDGPSALEEGRVSRIDLKPAGLVDPRGLAVHPSSGHLYLLDASGQAMHELTAAGQVVATFDLAPFKFADPQGLAFAPSGDPTDDPSIIDLYIADPGLYTGQLHNAVTHSEPSSASDRSLVPEFRSYLPLVTQATGGQDQRIRVLGRIVEASFAAPHPLVSTASVVPATLENTTLTSLYVPPSPDPSGLAYLRDSGTLMICDGEVDETPLFDGASNVFETALAGSLITVTTTISFSYEPTGVAYNPSDRHLFFTDDNLRRVFEMDPGVDELYGTSDDIITWFSTQGPDFGSQDPEGVAFDTWNGHLFVVDGLGKEVYEIDPGDNGIFDGVSGDDVVTQFDAEALGLGDPEGIEFDPNNGHLYILSGHNRVIAETLTDGTLVQKIDLSSVLPASGKNAAGLAYAPSSSNPAEMHIYIVDRGVDNDTVPDENDGVLYEISFDQAPAVIITAPTDGATFSEGEVIAFTGTAVDAKDGALTPSLAWTSSLDESIGTSGSFTAVLSLGTHTVTAIVTDSGGLTGTDQIILAIVRNQSPTVDAGPDQAISLPSDAYLDGTVTDDGWPDPPAALALTWIQLSGPGTVTLGDTSTEDITASFPYSGTYVLQLTADDGELTTSDQVTIVVTAPTVEVRVSSSSDDAEEQASSQVWLASDRLELVRDSGNQTVGIRFNEVGIPYGATILDAYIQFQASESTSEVTSLTVEGQDVVRAPTFTSSSWDVSSRIRTTASVPWSPPPWSTRGEGGPDQRTPDLSSVIQETIDRSGWSDGNSLVIIITGTGKRVAVSYDGDPAGAPLLHVEYVLKPGHKEKSRILFPWVSKSGSSH